MGDAWNTADVDVGPWAQCASLALVGALLLTQARSFLLQVLRATRSARLATNVALQRLPALLAAQVMGMYFLSSVVLLRESVVPRARRRGLVAVFGDDARRAALYHTAFDGAFIASSAATLLFKCARARARTRQGEIDAPMVSASGVQLTKVA